MSLEFEADVIAQAYGQGVPSQNGAAPPGSAAMHACCDGIESALGAACFAITDVVISVCYWAYEKSTSIAERLGPGHIPAEFTDFDFSSDAASPHDLGGGGGARYHQVSSSDGDASESLMGHGARTETGGKGQLGFDYGRKKAAVVDDDEYDFADTDEERGGVLDD